MDADRGNLERSLVLLLDITFSMHFRRHRYGPNRLHIHTRRVDFAACTQLLTSSATYTPARGLWKPTGCGR